MATMKFVLLSISLIAPLLAGEWTVAAFAGHRSMRASKLESMGIMETGICRTWVHSLPVDWGVTAAAFVAALRIVRVLVAIDTTVFEGKRAHL